MRGIRLHLVGLAVVLTDAVCYCPREGYKAASGTTAELRAEKGVTVPVRGIRLHQLYFKDLL